MPKYYLVARPPGIGCQPDGWTTFEIWVPTRERDGRHYFGWVEYPEPLPPEKIWEYELRAADDVEHAEYVFWHWERKDGCKGLRAEYLAAARPLLERMAPRDMKAWAALVILDAQAQAEGDVFSDEALKNR